MLNSFVLAADCRLEKSPLLFEGFFACFHLEWTEIPVFTPGKPENGRTQDNFILHLYVFQLFFALSVVLSFYFLKALIVGKIVFYN